MMQKTPESRQSHHLLSAALTPSALRETIFKSLMAGLMIGIGGTVYLSCDDRVVGALLFTTGLLTICNMGYLLFTGKVCYALENSPGYSVTLLIIALGNVAACVLYGAAVRQFLPQVAEKAAAACDTKLLQTGWQTFFLALMCGILMYIAVVTFRRQQGMSRYVGIVTCVPAFILSGFEHSIADAVYLGMAGLPAGSWRFLVVVLLGNAAGGLLFPVLQRLAGDKS